MLTMSRRGVLASAAVAAAFGLHDKKLAFISPAHAEAPLEPANGVYKYKVGTIEVTAVYDGIWRKPHDPTFIKNASVEDTKEALTKAGLTTEYNWWTEPGRVEKLPDGRKPAGKRIGDVFPTWKNWKLVEDNAEVAPGVRLLAAPGHTPGHSAFLVTSGKDQLMVSNDAMYVPALLAPHPDWQGAYDQDGTTAVATRRKLIDRVIADKMMICGAHFPFPGRGTFARDGDAYAFTPLAQA